MTDVSPESIEALQKSVELDPSHAPAWYNLGASYAALGDFQHAIEPLQKSVELDPSHAPAWYNLRGANLREAKLYKADLSRAKYTSKAIWPEDFDPTHTSARLVKD